MLKKPVHIFIGIAVVILAGIGIYYLPPVHSRLAWRIDSLRARIVYAIKPPDEAVFQPEQDTQIEAIVQATMQAYQATPTPTPRPDLPTPSPTITPTPLPGQVVLEGVKYEDQHNRWNYCGPANFSMSLTYWGWDGNRDVVGKAIKPSDKDKNVMPYELQDFVSENVPDMSVVLRLGGDIDLVKRLLAGGFPVLAEKGYYEMDYTGKLGWMGHYQFITGYDDSTGTVIVQDTYLDGPDFHIKYDDFMDGWRSFDYVFMVTYPSERESEVMALLGPYADETWAANHALEVARDEAQTMTGIDRFFAYFNVGTSQVALQQYGDATYSYDFAFQLYNGLGGDNSTRPYRMMWYQTGPYKAYFYSARYQDVINLATTTLEDTISEPVLEESLYWRGMAYTMAGQTQSAINDYRAALKVHPKWVPATLALQDLGVKP